MPRRKAAAEPVQEPVAESNAVEAGTVPPPERKSFALPKGWSRAADALDSVQSVRTIFPDFNRAVRIGGLPVRRIITVHGPTHHGKTAWVLGLLRSFADGGHMAALVDAEFATGREFASELMGDLEQRPNLMSVRPRTYEETVDNVDRFLKWVAEVKKDQPHVKSICVVDSINKLVPAKELERILKDQGGGEEMAKGHWGRQRAAMNQAWLDHLVPLLAAADCALVLVAQERDEAPDNPFQKRDDWKVKGGAALLFDASLLIRVTKMKPLYDGEEKAENIIGFRHRMQIYKSKVGHMDGRDSNAIFHLSNGKFSPPGFDTARDALMVGRAMQVVGVTGAWFTWRKHKWQGENRAVTFLSQNPDVLMQLLDEVNNAVDKDAGRNG